jgi:hypothetical protein
MAPGDNYAIAGYLNGVTEPTQLQVDVGVLASGVVLSETLTVWRKLWIEQDSMRAVATTGNEKNYVSGVSNHYELTTYVNAAGYPVTRTRIYLGQSLPSGFNEEGHYTLSSGFYRSGTIDQIVREEHTPYFGNSYIEVGGDFVNNPPSTNSYDLYDDDYDKMTLKPRITLPKGVSLDNWAKRVYNEAYITPVLVPNNPRPLQPFIRNLDDGDFISGSTGESFDNLPSSGYWSAQVVIGFQPENGCDGDPDNENDGKPTLGFGPNWNHSWNRAVVFTEVAREADKSEDFVLSHEIGHTAGLPECNNPQCIMSNKMGSTGFCDVHLLELRQKTTSW